MYIPTLKKVLYTNNVQIERALPAVGKINIAKGEKTEPFTRLGMSKISYKQMEISTELEFIRTKGWKNFYYSGEKIGKWNSKYIIAPFDGYLEKFEKYAFGKILYVGNYASVEIVEKAIGLGVVGILAGGADEPAFAIAKKNKIFLGLFSGFGKAPT